MRNRRILAAVAFLAIAGLLVFGAIKVIGELNKKDPPPPKTKPVKTTTITIPEGLDRDQIAGEAQEGRAQGDYERGHEEGTEGLRPRRVRRQGCPNLEGFLFPATYDLPKNGTVKDLVQRQLEDFKGNIAGVDLSYAKSKNLTVYDVLKIASMIEREVQVPRSASWSPR